MNDILKELTQAEIDTKNQIIELQNKLRQIEVDKLNATPVTLSNFKLVSDVLSFNISQVSREDIKELIRDFNLISSYSYYTIPAITADSFLTKMESLNNVIVDINSVIRSLLVNYQELPHLRFELVADGKLIKIHESTKTDKQLLYHLKDMNYNYAYKSNVVPVNSIYHLQSFIELYHKKHPDSIIIVDPQVSDLLNNEIERRSKYERILNSELDPIILNGWELKPFQTKGVALQEQANGNFILAYEQGLGKTPTFIGYAESLLKTDPAKKIIIVGKAKLRANWARNIKKFTDKPTYHLSGSKPTDVDITQLVHGDYSYYYINFESLAGSLDSTTDEGKKEQVFPWVMILNMLKTIHYACDEAHYIKNPSSNRSKAFTELIGLSKTLLTASPMKNGPGDLYNLLKNVAPNIAGDYETFIRTHTINNGKVAKDPASLHELLQPFMHRVRTKDVFKELAPIDRQTVEYELSAKAKMVYQEIENDLYTELESYDPSKGDNSVVIQSMLAKMMRMKQCCSADLVDFTAEYAVECYESSIEAESEHPKVIIFTQFVNSPPIAQRFVDKLYPHAVTTCNMKDSFEMQKVVDRFQNDPSIHYIVISASAMEGLDITAAGYVLTNDLMWVPDDHKQIEGRAYGRVSDLHPVKSHYMIALDTIMENIVAIHMRKLDQSAKVIDGIGIGSENIMHEVLATLRKRD